jgi:hypothetical protein
MERLAMIDPTRPFFSHATKDLRYFAEIVRCGRLICPKKLSHVVKFSSFADDYFRRTSYVMFSPGFGYIIDNANMQVSFVFSERILTLPGALAHLNPIVYAACELIVSTAKQRQTSYWVNFFERNKNTLGRFNHPSVRTTFSEYMLSYLSSDGRDLVQGDSWGPSTYSEGVVTLLYENNPSIKHELAELISTLIRENTLTGAEAQDYFSSYWQSLRIYRTPFGSPLSPLEKSHIQLLIPEEVKLWDGALIGICVPPSSLDPFISSARSVFGYIPHECVQGVPIFCGAGTFTFEKLITF